MVRDYYLTLQASNKFVDRVDTTVSACGINTTGLGAGHGESIGWPYRMASAR